jgi:hypothetical protein
MSRDPEVPNQDANHSKETDRSVSRRAIAKKIAYVAPTVLAVIAASERPALAQSIGAY